MILGLRSAWIPGIQNSGTLGSIMGINRTAMGVATSVNPPEEAIGRWRARKTAGNDLLGRPPPGESRAHSKHSRIGRQRSKDRLRRRRSIGLPISGKEGKAAAACSDDSRQGVRDMGLEDNIPDPAALDLKRSRSLLTSKVSKRARISAARPAQP